MAADAPLYSLQDALADVFSSPLKYVDTGPWYGMVRVDSCVYRNDRVLVVNVYCTKKEQTAFRIDVFSPTRGRAMIYAEAKAPISTLTRARYLTFKAEVEPATNLPAIDLDMTMAKLHDAEEARYKNNGPMCWGGFDGLYGEKKPTGDCRGALASRGAAWKKDNLPFLDKPSADWYRLVKELRGRAAHDGRDSGKVGG